MFECDFKMFFEFFRRKIRSIENVCSMLFAYECYVKTRFERDCETKRIEKKHDVENATKKFNRLYRETNKSNRKCR